MEQHFLNLIQAEPDDPMHRLVYADWLEEQGSPLQFAVRKSIGKPWEDVWNWWNGEFESEYDKLEPRLIVLNQQTALRLSIDACQAVRPLVGEVAWEFLQLDMAIQQSIAIASADPVDWENIRRFEQWIYAKSGCFNNDADRSLWVLAWAFDFRNPEDDCDPEDFHHAYDVIKNLMAVNEGFASSLAGSYLLFEENLLHLLPEPPSIPLLESPARM